MAELNGKQGVWRTVGGRRIFIVNGQDLPSAMKLSDKFKKKYIGEKYTSENVNDYFQNIKTYSQYEEFVNDFFQKLKMIPYIIPKKYEGLNNIREWVDFIHKIDEENISFSVLSEDISYSRRTKSSIKNFVKNYRVHLE